MKWSPISLIVRYIRMWDPFFHFHVISSLRFVRFFFQIYRVLHFMYNRVHRNNEWSNHAYGKVKRSFMQTLLTVSDCFFERKKNSLRQFLSPSRSLRVCVCALSGKLTILLEFLLFSARIQMFLMLRRTHLICVVS